jgi:hypothetical protein
MCQQPPQCSDDDDCNSYDKDYCDNWNHLTASAIGLPYAVHERGVCGGGQCYTETTSENCGDLEQTCERGECVGTQETVPEFGNGIILGVVLLAAIVGIVIVQSRR